MDPLQSRVYATAQRELQELFREISSQGQVGPDELQTALLPFTAGDVRNDVLELIDELRRRHKSSVDEQEFIRVVWKKMYASHLALRTKCRPSSASRGACSSGGTATRPESTDSNAIDDDINIPLAHVIVSIKRRSQLRQFADYYASRGISGADHLTAEAPTASGSDGTTRGSPRHIHTTARQQLQRRRVCFDRHVALPVASIRAHTSSSYRAVACMFDPTARAVVSLSLLPRAARNAQVVTCSKLFVVLFSKDAGSYVLGNAHFAQHARSEYLASVHAARVFDAPDQSLLSSAQASDASLPSPLAVRDDVLIQTKLEDLGLRHVVTAASSDGSFVACTERKIHHWTERGCSSPVPQDGASANSGDPKTNASLEQQQQQRPVVLSLDKEGDCFGVLGAKKLLARTKNIADVSFVKQLAAGADFALALTAAGDVFAWGDSLLGHYEVSPWLVPWLRSSENKVVRIACGRRHVLATTANGLAYAWGSNMFGQLGHGDASSMLGPPVAEPAAAVRIPVTRSQQRASGTNTMDTSAPDSDHAVLDVACGDDHSVLLLGSGRVYAFGNNWQGQVGVDPASSAPDGNVFMPTEVALPDDELSPGTVTAAAVAPPPFGARVYLITAYGASTAAVTTHGDVYQWGLCVPSGPESVCGLVARWTPQRVPIREREDDGERKTPTKHQRLLWHSIAIANGLVALTQHTEVLLT